MTFKVLESEFKGIRYRSRMEARWAVFMDILNIRFLYEPEAYDLAGTRYLPDFYLPIQECFVEIKNPENIEDGEKKCCLLSLFVRKPVFLFQRPPVFPDFLDYDHEGATKYTDGHWSDTHYVWCECHNCRRRELQFDGRADRINCNCPKSQHGDKGYNYDAPALIKAYQIAKSWRFEPGAYNP